MTNDLETAHMTDEQRTRAANSFDHMCAAVFLVKEDHNMGALSNEPVCLYVVARLCAQYEVRTGRLAFT